MSRRPSTLSILPGPLPTPNGPVHLVAHSPVLQTATRTPLASKLSDISSETDPDVLFTKFTIKEVEFFKDKLLADADAKKEELRLMVGERYRDLLQASTSIVSISNSSGRVIEALHEARDAILSQSAPPPAQRSSIHGADPHLHALQVLSAHMKLLLDAPEHLWRLIERKKYFTAAWLFRLANVVHLALDRDSESQDDEPEIWEAEGIDVKEQFPLVKRQWEVVRQFSSQITRKATASLREYTTSSEDVCSALLTLHLLESRPLPSTLSVFLNQRAKTFASLLLRGSEGTSALPPRQPNGHITIDKRVPRKGSVREVKEAVQTTLEAMIKTLICAREVFEKTESKQSMIRTVLELVESNVPTSDAFQSLPRDLQISSQSILATLPSSTHFLLLPSTVRTYRPNVDLSSPSTSVDPKEFNHLLHDWFQSTKRSLEIAVSTWFSDLQTITEVWSLRATIRQWIAVSALRQDEKDALADLFDEAAQNRVLSIWNLELADAGDAFQTQLASATTLLRDGPKETRQESSPIHFLFDSPPLPVASGPSPGDSSFQKYKAGLCRQLIGRTALLDSVLATLENCARSLQRDIAVVLGGKDEDSRSIAATLSERYQPDADSMCESVIKTLSTAVVDQEKAEHDSAFNGLTFLGRVADELSSSSPFFADIGCGADASQNNKAQVKALHNRIIDRWRTLTVSRLVKQQRDSFHPLPKALSYVPSAPSSILFESLITISTSLQELGLSRAHQTREADTTLRLFVQEWVAEDWNQTEAQALCDIAFLRRLADLRTPEWDDVCRLLDAKTEQLHQQPKAPNGWNDKSGDQLACSQTIFAALLPFQSPMRTAEANDKSGALLPFGVPPEQPFQSLLEYGDQSTRFGMLIVDTSTH
uniref:Conserved oligomeric Golgi complex subunit 1 n=1 Tax=Mycena chlorophos TaxID=658473 RepID=A0ABQ0M7I8_MYCCL|nr:predicted protein [Mycena chlorophos]